MRNSLILLLTLATPSVAQDATEGREVFRAFCAVCHGAEARGNGPMAEVLEIPPTNLTLLSASHDGRFPTFQTVRRIDGRDLLLAHGGEMPLFGHLFDMPMTAIPTDAGQPILTSKPIADVVTWLMTVQE